MAIHRVQSSKHDGGSDLKTARQLLPYLWPTGAPQLRLRLIGALALILAAKGVTLLVPMFYKYAVDELTRPEHAFIVVPVMLIVAYGGARVIQAAFQELREIVFTRVSQYAIHVIALHAF